MKTIKSLVLLCCMSILTFLCFTSCVSVSSGSGYAKYPEENTTYGIEINDVTVSNDKVLDTDIADQIYAIVESILGSTEQENTIPLQLDIEIIQRSFFYKIEQKNSIYVSYYLYDADNLVMQKGFYIETSETIISSKTQYKISQRITKEIKRFIKKSTKLYKEKK